jgi:subtilisin family serine protease
MNIFRIRIKKEPVIVSVLFALLIIISPLFTAAQSQIAGAGIQANTRIIIKMNVPRIDELTAASNRYCSPDPGKGAAWGGLDADMALADSIAYAAQGILTELRGTAFEVNHIYRSIPYMALQVSPEALALLQASPAVLGMEEDVPMRLIDPVLDGGAKGNPPASTDEANPPLLDTSVNLIGANSAWSMGFTGSGWYVAILDTGIRRTHEFFQGKTIVEACYAMGYSTIAPAGDCPNGLRTMTGLGSAVHHPNTYGGYDHGTHVAGIATGNNGVLFGVAKNSNIIAVQVFSKFPAGSCGGTPCVMSYVSDQVAGLDYIYSIRGSYSIASVNMSLGGGSYTSPCDTASQKASIDNLRSAGIATAIATGNNGYCGAVSSPACVSTSVAVGSSTDADAESGFNNWHATLQKLFAPGSSIYSSTGASDTSYASWNGTSMATPHVAGSWALLKQAKPAGTVSEFLSALQATGVAITSTCPGGTPLPRIQVNAAIASILPLRITAPNGGESWPLGGTRSISWASTVTTSVKLVLFKGGVKVGNIAANLPVTPGSSSYSWTVGNYIGGTASGGTGYTVRIIDMSGQYSDYSDASFSILGVTLTSPNGGEIWKSGATMPVTWSSAGVGGNGKLVLFKNGVKVGNIVTDIPVSGGTYNWTVGNYIGGTAAVGTGHSIRVITMDGVYKDDSDAPFTIAGLTLTSPNGGESWTLGGTRAVTWISAGGVTGNLKLVLFRNGVKVGNIATDIPVSGGTYSWTAGAYQGGTAVAGSGYNVRVITMDGQYSDYGNNTFTLQ